MERNFFERKLNMICTRKWVELCQACSMLLCGLEVANGEAVSSRSEWFERVK